jgi:hypothetical protein
MATLIGLPQFWGGPMPVLLAECPRSSNRGHHCSAVPDEEIELKDYSKLPFCAVLSLQ